MIIIPPAADYNFRTREMYDKDMYKLDQIENIPNQNADKLKAKKGEAKGIMN